MTTDYLAMGISSCTISDTGDCTNQLYAPQCEGRPHTEMIFRFDGGNCSSSQHHREAGDGFTCKDLSGIHEDTTVMDRRQQTTKYFEGYVNVDQEFHLIASSDGEQLPVMVLVVISKDALEDDNSGGADYCGSICNLLHLMYDDPDATDDDNIVQIMEIQLSCAVTLFIGDKFGSIQLLELNNNEQGKLSSYQTVNMHINVLLSLDKNNDGNSNNGDKNDDITISKEGADETRTTRTRTRMTKTFLRELSMVPVHFDNNHSDADSDDNDDSNTMINIHFPKIHPGNEIIINRHLSSSSSIIDIPIEFPIDLTMKQHGTADRTFLIKIITEEITIITTTTTNDILTTTTATTPSTNYDVDITNTKEVRRFEGEGLYFITAAYHSAPFPHSTN